MDSLYQEIFNIIEDREDLTLTKVAQELSWSKQGISKFKSKGVIGFQKLLRLAYLLFPDNPHEMMSQWCLRLTSTVAIKQSFEFAAITRNIFLLETLLKKHRQDKGTLSEYVAVYSIFYDYTVNRISGFDLTSRVKSLGTIKDQTLMILIEVLKCYNYYYKKKFSLMLETAREAEQMILTLNDSKERFMKECYLHRIAEVLGPVYLHMNQLKLARHYASIIIHAEISNKSVSDAYYVAGMSYVRMSYLRENTFLAQSLLNTSVDYAKLVGETDLIKEAQMNLNFVTLYMQGSFQSMDVHSLHEEVYQKEDEDFIILLKAIRTASVPELYQCFDYFFSQQNYYFTSMTAMELYRHGETSEIIKRMIYFTTNVEESVYFEKTFICSFIRYSSNNGGLRT